MLLTASIYVHEHVAIMPLFEAAVRQVAILDRRNAALLDYHVDDDDEDGRKSIFLKVDQGLSVNAGVIYRPDAMVITEAEAAQMARECPKQDCGNHQPCHTMVGVAVLLNYTDDRPWNAGNLIASMVHAMADYLEGLGLEWSWTENLTGTFHEHADHADALPGAVERLSKMPSQLPPEIQAMMRFLGLN